MDSNLCWGGGGVRHVLPKKNDKNGAVWCILSIPKICYYQPKNQHFRIINQQQPKSCAIFFLKINSDAHVSTKTNTFTFYNGDLAPRRQRNFKKLEAFLFLHKILHTRRVDSPVMMWIQICVGGPRTWSPDLFFLLLKWCNLTHSECSKIRYYQPKINKYKDNKSTVVKLFDTSFTNINPD